MSLGKGVCESGAGGVESVDWRVVKAVSVGVEESLYPAGMYQVLDN
jgi:hypothetical protein